MGVDNWDDDAPPRSARREGDPRSGSGSGRPGVARDGRTPSRPRRDDVDEPRRPRRDDIDDRGGSRPRRDEPNDSRGGSRSRREEIDEPVRRSRRDEPNDSRGGSGSRGRRDEYDELPRRPRGRDDLDEAPRRSRNRDDIEEPPRRSRRDEFDEPPRRSRRDGFDEAPRRSRRDEYDEPRRSRSRRSGYDDDENFGHRMMNVLTGRARAVRPGDAASASAPPAKGGNFLMPILLMVVVAWLVGAGAAYTLEKPGPVPTSDIPAVTTPATTGTPSLTPQVSPSPTK